MADKPTAAYINLFHGWFIVEDNSKPPVEPTDKVKHAPKGAGASKTSKKKQSTPGESENGV